VYGGGEQMTQGTDKPRLPSYFTGLNSFGSFQSKAPQWVMWLVVAVVLLLMWRVVTEQWPPERRTNRFWVGVGVAAVAIAGWLVWARNFTTHVPWVVVFMFGVATVVWVLLRYTHFGRSVYAIGGNPVAARLSGVPVARYTMISFVITSTIAAISGIVLAANQGTAVPGIATGFLLPAYAAVFLSTVILSDGRFHVWGTVIGGIAVVYVAQGLIIGGVEFTWNQVINGLVLIVAVSFATIVRGNDSMRAH
jgi:ribose/xylose/arabinose/galactoside ABC-type transport system permease subunit